MMFRDILQSVFNFFCGTTSTPSTPPEKPYHETHQYPPQQQPQWPQHTPHTPQATTPHGHGKPYQDANQINQSNEQYVSLRAQANEHGDQMAKAFRESHEAYSRGDGALAKQLSNEGREHQRTMEQLNKQASNFIYIENNKDSKPGEIDLHGLYVKEAIFRADQAIQSAKLHGESQINFIVGKGLHSSGGVAKIKPAIEELIQKYQLTAQMDPTNSGVLIVYLQAAPGQRGIGADEISRRIERDGESCTIM